MQLLIRNIYSDYTCITRGMASMAKFDESLRIRQYHAAQSLTGAFIGAARASHALFSANHTNAPKMILVRGVIPG